MRQMTFEQAMQVLRKATKNGPLWPQIRARAVRHLSERGGVVRMDGAAVLRAAIELVQDGSIEIKPE